MLPDLFLNNKFPRFNFIHIEQFKMTAYDSLCPLVIQYEDENGFLCTDIEAIDKIFLNEEVRHRKIVVLSIIGAFRQGKSFFIGYCMRFLYAKVS